MGANFKDLNSNRIKVFNQIAMLNQLGFIAFSVNLKDPALDIFVKSRDRLLLSMLKNEGRNLNSILSDTSHGQARGVLYTSLASKRTPSKDGFG